MRKKLLITTALVAAFTATNAYAKIIDTLPVNGENNFSGDIIDEEHTGKKSAINYNANYLTDKEITIKNIYMQTLYGENEENRKGMDVGEQVNTGSANTQKLVISDGARLDINRNQGDEGFLGDPSKATNLFNVNGGTVELNDGELHADGIVKITDGNITLNGSEFIAEDAGAKLVIEGGTINLINGNERFNGIGVEITEDNPQEGLVEAAWGPVEMSGGTINVLSGDALDLYYDESSTGNLITGTSLNISGGELNINEGAGVSVIKGFINEHDLAKGDVNLTDEGIVNLSGTLRANISGDGNLNIKTSNALVDGNVSGSNLTFEADHTLSQAISGQIDSLASLNVNKGTLTYDKTADSFIIGKVEVSDGAGINLIDNGEINSDGTFTSSGNIISGQDAAIHANGIEINNGNITLNGTDFTNDSLSESFKMTDGTITMNGNQSVIGTNHGHGHEKTNGKFEMTGGNVNVQGSENYIEGGDVAISGGAVNIAQKATLQTVATLAGSGIPGDIATIKLTDEGTINLSGSLISNVSGNGNINIKDSSALLNGDLSGSNLTFEADHSLSQAITGTIGELASLNVNKGTLNFDKQTGLINEVNVAENAGLKVNIPGSGPAQENVQLTANSFTSSGNIELLLGSDITAQNNLEINGGSVAAVNGDLESFNTININGGTLNLSDSSDITALKGLNINGGEINISDGEIWSLGDINFKGGAVNLSNFAAITTDFDDLDGIFNGTQKPETAGNINITGSSVNVEDKALLISEGNINLNGTGVIDVQDGATLFTTKTLPDEVEESDLTAFIKDNKATINLTDTGTANISGTLLANVEGDGNLNIKSSNAVINGDIKGSQLTFETDHSLSKALLGENIELASLNVNKGTLTFDEQPTSITNLNVAGGLDIGANTVKATNVSFKDNSTLKFTVAGKEDGSYGKIKADTINVSTTGTKLDLTLNSSVLGKDEAKEFTILDGSVTGDFAELSKNSRYEFEKLGNGQYKITGKASAADIAVEVGGNANNVGTATAWDGVSLDNPSGSTSGKVANALAELAGKPDAASQKAYVDALTAVAPEVAPMVQHTQTETANQVFGAVSTRLTGGSVSTGGEGMSSGDNIFERAAMWVQGLFNKSKLDDTSKSYGFDADSKGIAMGAEKYVTEDTKVGLGYAYTNTDIDGFKRETDVDTHTAFVYGEYKPSNWYVNGIASYGWSDYDESKNVAGINVKSDYDAETFGLQAMTGYDMQLKHFGLTPEVGLRYVHISQDGYTDSADQKVSGNDSDILTGVIGAKVNKTWTLENGMNIKPEARIAATYDLMNDDVNSVVTLANGSAYAVEGDALDRFGMEFGAGVTTEVNDNVEFALGYEGKFREDYQDHTGLVNLKYKF